MLLLAAAENGFAERLPSGGALLAMPGTAVFLVGKAIGARRGALAAGTVVSIAPLAQALKASRAIPGAAP